MGLNARSHEERKAKIAIHACNGQMQVLAPGLRLGWATAAPALLEKLIFHLHGSTLGPCALSQVVVASLLQHWGQQGFEQHVKDMQQGYARRAHILHTAAGELSIGYLLYYEVHGVHTSSF